ncbi:MAG: hypothetical protein RL385_5199, partial [Pseudomonadota bacterium]
MEREGREFLGLAEARLVIKAGETKTSNSLHSGAHDAAMAAILRYLDEQSLLDRIVVVGHRVVHGGERFTASALVTPEVLADIEAVSAL